MMSFGKCLWHIPCSSITSFDVKYGALGSASIVVHAEQTYIIHMLIKKDVDRLHELFPRTPTREVSAIEKPQPLPQTTPPRVDHVQEIAPPPPEPVKKQKPAW